MTTAGSGGMTTGTAEPGVIEEYYYLRLDKADVFLDGKVEVAFPSVRRRRASIRLPSIPKSLMKTGVCACPMEGVITFTLDVTGMTDRVVTEHPCIPSRRTW